MRCRLASRNGVSALPGGGIELRMILCVSKVQLGKYCGGYRILLRPSLLKSLLTLFFCLLKQEIITTTTMHIYTIEHSIIQYCISLPITLVPPTNAEVARSRGFGSRMVANGNCVCNDGWGNGDRNSKTGIIITAPIISTIPFSKSCPQSMGSSVPDK
jgi:hypothetical protein